MKLSAKIRPYPFWWKLLPLKNFGGNTIYPFIFLRDDFYKSLQTKNPTSHSLGILEHEKFHLERQKRIGFMWFVKYFLFPSFRFNEELEAYIHQMKFLKSKKEILNIEKIAKYLSGPMYLWSNKYLQTKEKLEKEWSNL